MVSGRLAALVLASSFLALTAGSAGIEVETSSAKLTKTKVPAKSRQESLLDVERFGRFAVTVEAPQGTALQVVSKMTGPGEVKGVAGETNGRVDTFLDRGQYKVLALSDDRGSGEAKLTVHPFTEIHAPEPPMLVEFKPFSAGLDDFQQISFWLQIDARRPVALEAAGRNLADMRFWKDGIWLVDRAPAISTIQPVVGKPLTLVNLWTTLEPGLYLVTAYGGPSQPWAEQSNEHPFHLRFGIPTVGTHARARHVVSEFGFDRVLVPEAANFFRLELPEAKPATIQLAGWSADQPFDNGQAHSGTIEKNTVPPAVDVRFPGYDSSGWTMATITAGAGEPYVLQHFISRWHYGFTDTAPHWVSTVHSGPPNDSVDATAIVARTQFEAEDYRTISYAVDAVEIDGKRGWKRRFNLLAEMTLFLDVKAAGKYQVEIAGEGVTGSAVIEPFFAGSLPRGYKRPQRQAGGGQHSLDTGLHVLTVTPDLKGIATVTVKPVGGWFSGTPTLDAGSPKGQVRFPSLGLDRDRGYGIWLNRQPGVDAGIVIRNLPVDLADPLPLVTRAGEIVAVPFQVSEEGVLRAIAEDGTALELSVDGNAWSTSANVKGGAPFPARMPGAAHEVKVRHGKKETVSFSLGFEPKRLQKWMPLPPLPDTAKNLLPDFPVLAEKKPFFMDIVRQQQASFLVKAEAPALYRLESGGLLATQGNLRTRTIVSFDRAAHNGVGRNFLLQQYLREGDYQLTVSTEGRSQGRMGLALKRTKVIDGGTLEEKIPARVAVPAGDAVVYRFTIAEKGEYSLDALGLNRTFRARLEDADGWPIVPVNVPANFRMKFEAGSYRLVVLPEPVDSRQVTRLMRIALAAKREGHGPHVVQTDESVEHVWTEPIAGSSRVPDVWTFEMAATGQVALTLTGEMQGTLTRDGQQVAIVPPERGWNGKLEAGSYRLEAICSRTNNQVPYTFEVRSEALLAGRSREVYPPALVPIAVGRSGLVELSSFGATDVRAELRTTGGTRLARNDDRPGDWNFHLAHTLAPGDYVLAVDPVGDGGGSVTVSMDMPAEKLQPAIALPAKLTDDPETNVFVHPLKLGAKDDFVLVSARSAESVGVALERKAGEGWLSMGSHVGREAHLEIPVDAGGTYRLRVWSVDRRGNPIDVAVASASVPPDGSEKSVSLEKVAGMSDRRAGAVRLERPGVIRLESGEGLRASVGRYEAAEASPDGLVSVPDSVLWLVSEGAKAKSSVKIERVTLQPEAAVGRGWGSGGEAPGNSAGDGEGLSLRMPPHGRLVVDLPRGKGPFVAVARARRGQPGAQAGNAFAPFSGGPMAPGERTAVAASLRAEDPVATIWAATPEGESLDEIRVRGFAFDKAEDGGTIPGGVEDALAAGQARVFSLGRGTHRLRLSGGEGVVAIVHDGDKVHSVHGGAGSALDETLDSDAGSLTVVSIANDAQRFRIEAMPIDAGQRLPVVSAKTPVERPAVAAGTLRLPFRAPETASTLRVRGGAGDPVVLLDGGKILTGRDVALTAGVTGTILVRHEPGWVLAILEQAGDPTGGLWGEVRADEKTKVDPPQAVTLKGAAHTLRVTPKVASVLHLRATTPAAVRIVRGDGVAAEVEVFPRGVVLDAYLPGGTAEITLRALGTGSQLSGGAELRLTPVTPVGEGLGPEVLLPAGDTRVFSFVVSNAGDIGIGVRADSDVVEATLLDASGKKLGSGVVQMRTLEAGTYFLALHVAEDAAPARVRAAVVGLKRPDTGPPGDVVRQYLEEAGVKATKEITP